MTDRYCLFCDKELKEREIFIQGMNPTALICNVCIGVCCEWHTQMNGRWIY
jgi:hypothetical protein